MPVDAREHKKRVVPSLVVKNEYKELVKKIGSGLKMYYFYSGYEDGILASDEPFVIAACQVLDGDLDVSFSFRSPRDAFDKNNGRLKALKRLHNPDELDEDGEKKKYTFRIPAWKSHFTLSGVIAAYENITKPIRFSKTYISVEDQHIYVS